MVVDYFRMFTNILPRELKTQKASEQRIVWATLGLDTSGKQGRSLFSEGIWNIFGKE
jgi:hypothetical protein